MINKVILVGNVGADPDIRAFESGSNVARLRIATTEKYKKDNEVRTLTEWHNIEAWGHTANIIDDYVRKGDRIYIEGSIHYQEYTDRNGIAQRQTIIKAQTVKMLSARKEETQPEQPQAPQTIPPAVSIPPAPPIDPRQDNQVITDDLPF